MRFHDNTSRTRVQIVLGLLTSSSIGISTMILASMILAGPGLADPFGDPRDVEIPELGDIVVPEPDRYVLDNGMVIYLLENHEFPVVDARALIRAGSIYESAEKTGLASITGQVMRTGGSTNIDGDALDGILESMGASVETSIGQTSGNATISTLSDDFGRGLEIMADILRNPAFPEEKIELAKKQERTSIASRNDEGMSILFREAPKLIYGADHPYARHTEYATVNAITRDDLVAFHREFVHPDRIILTVYGDFDPVVVRASIEEKFGDWPPATSPIPGDPEVGATQVSGNFLISKSDMTNSVVLMGHEGMRNDDPDYAAMQLYHTIMGGGFSSRLFNEIRTKRGLAYATGSTAGSGLHHPGAQIYFAATQSDSTVKTLEYIRAEIEKSLAEPFTDEEVQRAKDGILNSLVFDFTSRFSVLNRLAIYEFYDYPKDFLQTYQANVKELGAKEILAAAQRNVRYDEMATVVCGNEENFGVGYAALGEVTAIDITIPEPEGEEIPIGTAADFERGQGLMSDAAAAHGASAIAGIADMETKESAEFSIQGMTLQATIITQRKLPDCEKAEQKLPMGTFIQSICGDVAWMNRMQGPEAMPEEMRADVTSGQIRDYVHLFAGYGDLRLQALPDQVDIEGALCDVVFVHSESVEKWKIYFDATSKMIRRMEFRDKSLMTGTPVMAREDFSDYRDVSGLQWPYERVISHDGDQVAKVTTAEIAVNVGITDSIFEMPSQ